MHMSLFLFFARELAFNGGAIFHNNLYMKNTFSDGLRNISKMNSFKFYSQLLTATCESTRRSLRGLPL